MSKFTHIMPLRVRYCECDPMGVAHHASYPVWFELGRTELLRSQGVAYRDLEAKGTFLVVARLDVRYKRPARYDDELVLHTTFVPGGQVKIEHRYELKRGDELLATSTTVLACVDAQGRPQAAPVFRTTADLD